MKTPFKTTFFLSGMSRKKRGNANSKSDESEEDAHHEPPVGGVPNRQNNDRLACSSSDSGSSNAPERTGRNGRGKARADPRLSPIPGNLYHELAVCQPQHQEDNSSMQRDPLQHPSGSELVRNPQQIIREGPSCGIFEGSSNVKVKGGSFNQAYGRHTNVTIHVNQPRDDEHEPSQHSYPPPMAPPSATASRDIPEEVHRSQIQNSAADNEPGLSSYHTTTIIYSPDNSNKIYERHLGLKQRGFPLWIPEPNRRLPMEYRRKGVHVGDVGIITPSGAFSFLFNVCLPPNHPINPSTLPEGFTPIQSLVIREYSEFKSESYLASTAIEKTNNDPPFRGLSFMTSAAEGAVLTLPDGAVALDLENIPQIRAYAAAHIENWYRYINGPRGCEAKNGEVRLVIGCDKATSWGMAAVANLSQHKTHYLKYRSVVNTGGSEAQPAPIPLYKWDYTGLAEARVGPDLDEIADLKRDDDSNVAVDGKYWNQCLFMRTLNLTLSEEVFEAINREVEAALVVQMQQFQKSVGPSTATSSHRTIGSQTGSNSSGNHQDAQSGKASDSAVFASTKSSIDSMTTARSPTAPKSHPADALNKLLLQKLPNCRVVITQDEDWCSVLNEDDEIMPTPSEIAERVLATHHIRKEDGIVYLEPKNPALRRRQTVDHSLQGPVEFESGTTGTLKLARSSSDRALVDNVAERSMGKDHSHRNADEAKSFQSAPNRTLSPASPSRVSPRSTPKIEYKMDPDMYTQNNLNTFSFGSAPSMRLSSSSSQLFDPLSRPCDEANADEVVLNPDTTPRASFVGSMLHRTHPSHPSRLDVWPSLPRHRKPEKAIRAAEKFREAGSDTASTINTSSASASVSSLTRPKGKSSRSASQISGRSDATPQTLSNDLTSDEEMDGRHPLPPGPLQSSNPCEFRNREPESLLYLSEEDCGNCNDDFDHDDFEIDPSNDTSSRSSYPNIGQPGRRGSVAQDIPDAQGDKADKYARQPTRSMDELSAFSFSNNIGLSRGGHGIDERSLAKSIQRDKDLPPILSLPSMASGSSFTSTEITNSSASSNDLQSQWQAYGANGLVAFDSSDMSDIVGEGNIDGRRLSYTAFRKGSIATYSRQSMASSVDIFNKHALGWGGNTFNRRRHMWMFEREKDREPDDSATALPSDGGKARSSVSTLFSSRSSTSDGMELSSMVSRTSFVDISSNKDKEKSGKEKGPEGDKPSKELWRGMALDSEEIWHNGAIGKFKILRKNIISNESGKPPQQRLNITFMRTPYIYNSTQSEHFLDGPAIAIHKHTKAGVFTILRHFRHRPTVGPNSTMPSLRSRTSSSAIGTPAETDGRKKPNAMILLGSRRVQYEYTSTNTTRKVESGGLLGESGRTSSRDIERMREYERDERARKEKERKRERKKMDKGKEKEHSKRKVVEPSSKALIGGKNNSKSKATLPLERFLPNSSGGSAGSIANPTSSSGSNGPFSSSSSSTAYETTSSDRITTHNAYQSHPRKGGAYDVDQDMDDEDDNTDERLKYPARTPRREVDGSLPTTQHEKPSRSLFGWGKPRGTDRHGNPVIPFLEAVYNPVGPTTLPRSNSETGKLLVDNVNTSFRELGLLPAIGEIKGSTHQQKHKHRDQKPSKQLQRPTAQTRADPFENVPTDAPYMLLPLWPGETDPVSAKIFPFTPAPIPVSERQYLMVYYKTSHSANPKQIRSHDFPSNSGDHERNIFLKSFHISARIVAYHDLQGSGIHLPDLGLAVSGRLEEAYMTMPNMPPLDLDDCVIGTCDSRERGIEFLQHGFEKLGLVSHILNTRSVTEPHDMEDDRSSNSMVMVLTPMGRAVMEMAWLGGMAVTSFNPDL